MKVHFIGIGGIGMSALARYFHSRGATVTGSDASRSPTIRELEAEGISVFQGHNAAHITSDMYQVIYSEAIPYESVERSAARGMGIPEKSYFSALGDISSTKTTVSICGTHGKSTTTAMAGLAFEYAGYNPLVILGTKVFEWGKKNIHLPKESETYCNANARDLFFVESCEYHNSFHHLQPSIIVVTNIEPDHLDFFGTEQNYYKAFQKFGEKLSEDQYLVANLDDPQVQKIFTSCRAQKINTQDLLSQVPKMAIPGEHNRQNAACVLGVAKALGLPHEAITESLSRFHGTWRRFEKKGEKNGILIFDDYAHHPTELRATLSSFREAYPHKKIWIVFQPHQYSRTREFLEEFAQSFALADEVLIPNIYRVRDTEEDVASVSAKKLVEKIQKNGVSARHTHTFPQTVELLQKELATGDVCITVGAGPIYEVGEIFLQE